ncbi:hypothetical protein WA588_001781 [Blastocystis sp. NMH]
MGQEISLSQDFNRYRNGVILPSWFIVDHDVTVTETRSALSFCRDHGLQNPVSFHLPGIPPNECQMKMYLLIYHRLGVVCPELIRASIQVDEDETISFRDYDKEGIDVGKFLYTIIVKSIPETLSVATAKIELHDQACNLVSYLYGNQISASVLLEIVGSILSAFAVFTDVSPSEPGLLSFIRLYCYIYELYYEMNLATDESANVTLSEIIIHYHQPLMEWTPVLLSSQCDVQDQLTQWLLICLNAVNHIVEGNQLCLNLKDVLLFAVDYTTLGLSTEEEHFQSVSSYTEKDRHYEQHQCFREKVMALTKQVSIFETNVVAKRARNVLIEWLTVHIRVTDKAMTDACSPATDKQKEDRLERYTMISRSDEAIPSNCTYVAKWQKKA